jgi:hypothetical protein
MLDSVNRILKVNKGKPTNHKNLDLEDVNKLDAAMEEMEEELKVKLDIIDSNHDGEEIPNE